MDTWILLRGLTREAAHWGAFAGDLRAALPHTRIVTLDLPGNGSLHTQTSPLTVPGMVAACRAELARQGLRPPYHVLAMSLGAMVATEWACTAPDDIQGCVLVNTSFRPFSPFFHRLRPRNYAALLALVLLQHSPEAIERTVWRLTSNSPVKTAVIDQWVAARALRPVSAANALRQLAAAARYRAPCAPPPAPMLLLASQRDGLVHHRCSLAIARHWQCALALHPQAGHDLPLDAPQWVIAQVQRWLEQAHPVPQDGTSDR